MKKLTKITKKLENTTKSIIQGKIIGDWPHFRENQTPSNTGYAKGSLDIIQFGHQYPHLVSGSFMLMTTVAPHVETFAV